MSAFDDIRALSGLPIWNGILARAVEGERITLAVVELDPNAPLARHSHPHEQLGIVIEGSMLFTVGDETKRLGPGETWTIRSGVEHEATAGRDGAVVIDVFSPPRDDWHGLESQEREPRWPR